MELPDAAAYAAAFAAAMRERMGEHVLAPPAPPDEPAPLDMTETCVFACGRFLPRGSCPDFPRRAVLAKHALTLHTGLCHVHDPNHVYGHCEIEFDNYGNILLRVRKDAGRGPGWQHPVYFLRSTESIATPIAAILALTLQLQKAASLLAVRTNIVCDDSLKVKCSAGHTGECPPPPNSGTARCSGRGPCSELYYTSSFPAGSKARMFAVHPDDLSAEQREEALQLCRFLEEHFCAVLGPLYKAVHAAQAVMACGVGPAADTPCMTMQGADTATRSVATDWSAVETVREQALASTRAYESANRALHEELAALLARDAHLRESLLAAEHDRDALGRKVAELEGALLVAKKLQDLPPRPPPCERCATEIPRLQALVGGAEHVELLRLREAVADAQKRGDRLEREARELTTEMKATVARAQAARKADADTISRQETELARLRGCAGDAQEKVCEALREAAGARQALSAAAAAPATSREGIIASLYAQIADLEKARAAADERAARAEARDAASRARLESLRVWASEECEPDPRDTPARRPK